MTRKTFPLTNLLKLERRPVKIELDQLYQEIGIFSHGKGIFHKEPRFGYEIGDKKLFLIKNGDFIFQITFAWEGAIALTSENEEGKFGSTRFPTFRVDETICNPKYLLFYFTTKEGLHQISKISPGSAGRNRVLSLKRMSEVEVPLPRLEEQERVVTMLTHVLGKISEVRKGIERSVEEINRLSSLLKENAFPKPQKTTVGTFIKFQTGYAFKSEWFSNEGVRLARNVNIGHGRLDWSDSVRVPDSLGNQFENFELREGDILISLDRPIISTGIKVAKVTKTDLPCLLLQRVARAQFDKKAVDANYFYHWLTSPNFISAINPGRSSGVPHISHKEIERIPFSLPPLKEQRRIAADLDQLQKRLDEVKQLQVQTDKQTTSLISSILNRTFIGE